MKKQFLCISIFSLSIAIVMSLTATIFLCCGNPNSSCSSTSYEYLQTNDSEIHIKICKRCEFPEQESHSFAWDFNTVHHWQECEDCGYSTSKTRHTFSSIFGNAGNGHVYICTGCNYRRTEAHIWGDDNICDVCGKQDTSSLDPEEIIIDPVTE